ncbi:hypothetical protein [Enterobacter sp. PTB]|uniref:hypothetical protein n=1 Tax=Enterobacter sp. PTB TaxID=3143437 RepID=UPI003DA8A447
MNNHLSELSIAPMSDIEKSIKSTISDDQLQHFCFCLTTQVKLPSLEEIQAMARELIEYRQVTKNPVAYTDADEIAASKCQAMSYFWSEPSGTGKDIALYMIK